MTPHIPPIWDTTKSFSNLFRLKPGHKLVCFLLANYSESMQHIHLLKAISYCINSLVFNTSFFNPTAYIHRIQRYIWFATVWQVWQVLCLWDTYMVSCQYHSLTPTTKVIKNNCICIMLVSTYIDGNCDVCICSQDVLMMRTWYIDSEER